MQKKPKFGGGTYVNKNTNRRTNYIRICRGPQRDMYVHKLVAEAKLGRKLEPGETVEHRDGDFWNNSPDNLIVVTRAVNTALMLQRNGSPLAPKALAGCGIKPASVGIDAAFPYGANGGG